METVKIVAESDDANVFGNVRVLNSEGVSIPHVYRIEWTADITEDMIPRAKIYTYCTEVDIETKADVVAVCPMCKKEIEETGCVPIVTETGENGRARDG